MERYEIDASKIPIVGVISNYILLDRKENTNIYAVSISIAEKGIITDGWPFLLEGQGENWFFLGKVTPTNHYGHIINSVIEIPNTIELRIHNTLTFLNQYNKGITNEELYEFNKNVFGNGY